MIWPDDMNMPPFSGDDHHAEAHRLLDTAQDLRPGRSPDKAVPIGRSRWCRVKSSFSS
jgi:hypothetical protein